MGVIFFHFKYPITQLIYMNLILILISRPALANEWCGFNEPVKEIEVCLGPKQCIRVMGQRGSKLHRSIDVGCPQRITIFMSSDSKQRYILVKLEKE